MQKYWQDRPETLRGVVFTRAIELVEPPFKFRLVAFEAKEAKGDVCNRHNPAPLSCWVIVLMA